MRQAGLSIEQVFKKTRQQVAWETANKQVPPLTLKRQNYQKISRISYV